MHKKEKNLCCEFCTKAFARKGALTQHIKVIHELSGNFACGFCDKKYSKSRDKIVHEKKHTGEKPYHCEKCDRGWSQYMAKKAAFTCETCNSSLLNVDSPVNDAKHVSEDTDVNLVPEKKDAKEDHNTDTNNTNMNLEQEIKNKHFKAEHIFEEKEQHVCKKCSKSFPLQAGLTLHIRKNHSFLAERGICFVIYVRKNSQEEKT